MAKKETVIQKPERLASIGKDLAVWRVHISMIKEQDKNARVMSPEMFNQITKNIETDGHLESLPLTMLCQKNDSMWFELISGHHRTRAARKAGIHELVVIAYERELTRDEIIAKQLSHNSLSGQDDPQLLKELYDEIESINLKITTGLKEFELELNIEGVSINDIKIDLAYEIINILFLPKQVEELEDIMAKVGNDVSQVLLADKADFEKYAEKCREIAKKENIINLSAILARMLQIVDVYYQEHPPEEKKDSGKKKK